MEQHPFDETAEGRGRAHLPPRTPGRHRRRRSGGQPGRQCRHGRRGRRRRQAEARRRVPPRRHGRWREGLHRRPVDHHEAGPGAPHLGVGDAAQLRPQLQAGHGCAGRGGDAGQRDAVDDPAQERHRVQQRQDAQRRRRHLLAAPDRRPEEQAVRRGGRGLHRPGPAQEDGRAHRAHTAQAPTRRSASSSASTTTASSRSVTRAPTKLKGSARARSEDRASRPASRACTSATRTTGGAASPTSTASGHRLHRPGGAGQRTARRQVDAMTDIPFAQVDDRQEPREHPVLESPGGGWLPLWMAVDMPPFDNVNVRKAMRLLVDRRCDAGPGAVRPRPRGERPVRAASTRSTRTGCRSATRTSSRPSRC